jgi:hypothetical protein
MTECVCLSAGPRYPDVVDERYIGRDKTEGRFADVTIRRCSRCRRLWLKYFVEYEFYTAAGRWAETPIDEAAAMTMTPEAAPDFLDHAVFYIFGGSYFGHAGHRSSGPISWW